MAYEYGTVEDMDWTDQCGVADTLEEAKAECDKLQQDWDGSHARNWQFIRGRWLADSDDKNVFWYVREIEE